MRIDGERGVGVRTVRATVVAAMAAMLLVTVLAVAPPVGAVDGNAGPDPTYAGDGTLDLTATRSPMVVDAQDRLLVLRATGSVGSQLRRYLPSGEPDPSFSSLSLPTVLASATRIEVLANGRISLVETAEIDSYNRTVRRVSSTGQLDTSYGDAGKLHIGVDQLWDPFIDAADGTIVAFRGTAPSGQDIVRYGADGKLDPTFSDDGVLEAACCAEATGTPAFQAVQPDGDGGGLVAVVSRGTTDVLVRYAADGSVRDEVPITVPGRAERLWAVPSGGFFLGLKTGVSSTSVHLDDDLQPDGGAVDPSTAYSGYLRHREGGGRTYRTAVLGTTGVNAGRARITAFDEKGVDRSYGTEGTITTEAMAPLDPDAGARTGWAAMAVAPDGRVIVVGSFTWARGVTNPSAQYGQRVEVYAPDGHRLHRWDSRVAATEHRYVAAEQVGTGFLVQGTVSTTNAQVRRWVSPREGLVPGPVRNAVVTVSGGQASASWTEPMAAPGLLVTGYEVTASVVGGPPGSTVTKDAPSTSTTVALSTTAPLTVHRFSIRARGLGGTLGPATEVVVAPPDALLDAFLVQLSTGFGTLTTPASRAEAAGQVRAGTASPASLARAAAQAPSSASTVDPVVRLYLAYFQRLPDQGGLRYWVGKRKTGTSVARISAVHEDSSEFRRTYGSLTNDAFVRLVYQNVLGRPGDAGGIAYWTGRLDRRATSRGHLMASFSESSEHVRRTRAKVDVVSLHWGLLGRTPTSAEVTRWAGPTPEGDAVALAAAILASAEYLARID